ncbi:hypothetical protein [Vibrio bivalvicida]|uniref:Uncharacterized protein n=1 Tax=Vibrio bivalvicida TaxID=1276888 RepID=A0A177Y349_9VIBR|nr:hypothetical protein [Vibrio bivalvicida]OAJ95227.1 hypothetical protein APB76_08065 [Vibrio bivalvicida]
MCNLYNTNKEKALMNGIGLAPSFATPYPQQPTGFIKQIYDFSLKIKEILQSQKNKVDKQMLVVTEISQPYMKIARKPFNYDLSKHSHSIQFGNNNQIGQISPYMLDIGTAIGGASKTKNLPLKEISTFQPFFNDPKFLKTCSKLDLLSRIVVYSSVIPHTLLESKHETLPGKVVSGSVRAYLNVKLRTPLALFELYKKYNGKPNSVALELSDRTYLGNCIDFASSACGFSVEKTIELLEHNIRRYRVIDYAFKYGTFEYDLNGHYRKSLLQNNSRLWSTPLLKQNSFNLLTYSFPFDNIYFAYFIRNPINANPAMFHLV